MSSSEINDGDITVIKSKANTSQTAGSDAKIPLEGELKVLGADIEKVGKTALKSLSGFRTFILRGNVIDLAIGIVIGAAFTGLVTSLVGDVITPLIPLPGKNSLGTWNITLPSPPYSKGTQVHVGLFINAVISFMIVAAVLYYFVVQPVNKLMKLYKPKEVEAHETRNCPYCFQAVHHQAVRCPYCTSPLTATEGDHEEDEPALVLPASLEKLSEKLAESIIKKASTRLEQEGAETNSERAAAKE